MIRFVCFALGFAGLASGSVLAQPKVSDKQMGLWVAKVSQLKPEEQETAFRAKMGELNPQLDTSKIKVVTDTDGGVTEVTIPGTYTEDIRPVALFRDLEKLYVSVSAATRSKIGDVSCLRGLTRLRELSLAYTTVKDVKALADLPLEKLFLAGTPVTDITALKKMPLTEIQLPDGVGTKQLDVLKGKPLRAFETKGPGPDAKQHAVLFGNAKLVSYQVGSTPLETLEPLANMPLTSLALGTAPKLRSLAAIKGCEKLHTFTVAKAPLLTDLGPLADKPLNRLEVPHCPNVVSIAAVKGMPLIHLNLTDTKVSDLAPLAGLNTLSRLELPEMQLKSLKPLADLPKLSYLVVDKTTVADKDFAPLAKLPALTHLYIDLAPMSEPVVKKLALKELNGKPFMNPK